MWDDVTSEVDYRHKSNLLAAAAASLGTITFLMTGGRVYMYSFSVPGNCVAFVHVCLSAYIEYTKLKDGINLQRDSFRFRRGEAVGLLALYRHYSVVC